MKLLLAAMFLCGSALAAATAPTPAPPGACDLIHASRAQTAERSVKTDAPRLEIPASTPVGEFVDARLAAEIPADAVVDLPWTIDGAPADPRNARVTADSLAATIVAKPGDHVVAIDGYWATVVDGKPVVKRVDVAAPFHVGDPPQPKPLAELAGDKAAALAELYAAHAKLVISGDYTSLGNFRQGVSLQLAKRGLADNPAVAEVWRRFETTVGAEDAPFSPELRDKVAAFLAAVVDDLGATPPPGPNDVAAKLWLVAIDRFEDRTTAQGALLADVEFWRTVEAAGHLYESYEAGSAAAAGYAPWAKTLPALVVQDAATGKVLGVETIPPTVDKAWAEAIVSRYSRAK